MSDNHNEDRQRQDSNENNGKLSESMAVAKDNEGEFQSLPGVIANDEKLEQDCVSPNGELRSPCRVKDIHLDGSADNMPNVNPYLLDDRDLDIQSEAGGNVGSVYSDSSEGSWKLVRTPRPKQPPSVSSSLPRSSIASRARQMKEHEGDAFLTIDLMPQTSARASQHKYQGQLRSSLRGSSCQTYASGLSTGRLTQLSGRNTARDGRCVKPRVLSAASSYVSPVKKPVKPNQHVKMPFKQSNASHVPSDVDVNSNSPSQGLTERTAAATHLFHRALREQKLTRTSYIQGRLLKARLKPMEPVQPSEPYIQQCRGIIAETRSYSQSDSRTFQRWQAIMAGGATAQQHLHLRDTAMVDLPGRVSGLGDSRVFRSASVCESVHQTSQASSSPTTTPRDLLNLEDEDIDDENDVNVPGVSADQDTVPGVETSDTAAIVETTSLPCTGSDDFGTTALRNREGPAERVFTEVNKENERPVMKDAENLLATEKDPADSAVFPVPSGSSITENFGSESIVSGSTCQPSVKGDNISALSQTSSSNRRPQSASLAQGAVPANFRTKQRPKTALDSRKAVRFADESKSHLNQDVVRLDRVKGKNSCRPHSLDSGFHDREDPDDSQGNSKQSSTFLTQMQVQTPKCSSGQTNGSHQQKSSGGGSSREAVSHTPNSDAAKTSSMNKYDLSLKSATLAYTQQLKQSKKQTSNGNVERLDTISGRKEKVEERFARYKQKKDSHQQGKQSITNKTAGVDDTEERQPIDKDEELRKIVGKFFKPADYAKVTKRPPRSQSAQARKAKALKMLRSQIKGGRPYSASSAYSDTIVSNKSSASSKKCLQGGHGDNFCEKTQILSKHGLLKSHGIDSRDPSPNRRYTGSCVITASQRESADEARTGQEVVIPETLVDVKSPTADDGGEPLYPPSEAGATYSGSARPKSASRVKFASRQDSLASKSRKSSASSASHVRRQLRRESATSQKSYRSVSSGFADDEMFDADLMWSELPSDHSDDDQEDDSSEQQTRDLVTEEDFFMAKFDLLDLQLEAAMAELRQEKNSSGDKSAKLAKSALKRQSGASEPLQLSSAGTIGHPSSTEAVFITHDDLNHQTRHRFEEKTDIEEPSDKWLSGESPDNLLVPASDVVETATLMAESQRSELGGKLTLSFDLYKKTDLFVKVPSSQKSGQEVILSDIKTGLNLQISETVNEVPLERHLDADEKTNHEFVREVETRREMERDYPMLYGVQVEPQKKRERMSGMDGSLRFGVPSAASLNNTLDRYKNYQEVLLAYRQHCMEDSEESDSQKSENDDDIDEQATRLGTARQHEAKLCPSSTGIVESERQEDTGDYEAKMCPSSTGIVESERQEVTGDYEAKMCPSSTGIVESERQEVTEEHAAERARNRPLSATTTDSGWESDSQHVTHQNKPSNNSNQTAQGGKVHGNIEDSKSSDSTKLEIVAHAKRILKKQSISDMVQEEPMSVLCQVPPLCFRLNARPPQGYLYYFAYGPNINPDRLCSYLKCERCPPRFWALLFGFGLVFNKKSLGNEDVASGGFANLEWNRDSSVEGCIYQLTPTQLDTLDAYMEYPKVQEHVVLPVWMSNSICCGPEDDIGVAQYCVPAVTYIAHNDATWSEPVTPNDFAVGQCIKAAADTCSTQYNQMLASFSPALDQTSSMLAITAAV